MPVRTSANFYRRGVPNSIIYFGKIVSGNYTVGQPKAVTVTAIAIHCNPTGEQQGTLDSLERNGYTYGGS